MDRIDKFILSLALVISIVPLAVFYANQLGMEINRINSIMIVMLILGISGVFRYNTDD